MLPEFRARGDQQRLELVFAGSRTRNFDLHFIAGAYDPRLYRNVLAELSARSGDL